MVIGGDEDDEGTNKGLDVLKEVMTGGDENNMSGERGKYGSDDNRINIKTWTMSDERIVKLITNQIKKSDDL